uniref:CCHC-type domain-containing protein n=1 Tax=Tanacetum cinerariifolium TaxID=118510 RepID=A0A699H894_TANCI|nr:hypothetical protein [Tanacetum cinerariifolium]
MRIPLLYRGEYSQWRKRFMNYLEEQTDGEAMINFIQNGDQPLHVIAQVSLAGNTHNAPPTLKDLKFWTAEEKKTRKIDRLVRSLLIQGLPNDIYSLIDSNETAKDLWDALERQMRGSEYGEPDRKAVILYEYETFKANKREQLLDTYLRYLQVINDLKKCGYKKNNCELNYKFLNNLQPEWKQYGTLMRQTKNLMDININALYNILKQNQGDVNDALGYKKKVVVVTSDLLALVAEKTKAFNRRKFYSKPTNNNLKTSSTSQSANKKQEIVKSNEKKEDKKADEKKRDMSKVKCYNCKKEGHFAKDLIKSQKNQNPEAGQTSMARDGSVFRYYPDYLREQFAGLVIQRALPFNHFDHEQTTRVFQNTMQPRYTHVEQNEAIPLSDEEIALDANASSEGTLSPGRPWYDYMMSSEAEDDY